MKTRSALAIHDTERTIGAATSLLNKVVKGISASTDTKIQISNIGSIAKTDGRNIYISDTVIRDLANDITADPKKTARTIAKLKGLVYHEMGHIMWSPRKSSSLMNKVASNGLQKHWNILEDQRIEAFLCERYHSNRFLVPALIDFLLQAKESDQWQTTVHPYVCGRRYLPYEIRKIAYDNWADDTADEISAIVDEYVTLVFPRDNSRALELIERFYDLVPQPAPFDDHTSISNGGTEKASKTNQIAEDVKESNERLKQEEEEHGSKQNADTGDDESEEADDDDVEHIDIDVDAESPSEAPEEGSESEGAPDDSEPVEGTTAGTESTSSSDSDDQSPDFTEGTGESPSGVVGKGTGESAEESPDLMDALMDYDEQLAERDVEDGSYNNDVKEYTRGLLRPTKPNATPVSNRYGTQPVPDNMRPMSKKIVNDLAKLSAKFAPAIKHRQMTGDINPLDYRNRQPGQTFNVFDQFKRDQRDQAAVEVMILVDISGSTNQSAVPSDKFRIIDLELIAAWVLKHAFDQLPHCVCSAMLFDDMHPKWLYKPDEKASATEYRNAFIGYGTDPYLALIEASKVFDGSNAKHKMIVILTDGQWFPNNSKQSPEAVIESYNKSGITTVLLGIGDAYQSLLPVATFGTHNCAIAKDIPNIMDMPKIMAEITKSKLFVSANNLNR
jgi:hypothetical protein